MFRKLVLVGMGILFLYFASGCATVCDKDDSACLAKQQHEYGRPFYDPSLEFER